MKKKKKISIFAALLAIWYIGYIYYEITGLDHGMYGKVFDIIIICFGIWMCGFFSSHFMNEKKYPYAYLVIAEIYFIVAILHIFRLIWGVPAC